MEALPPVGWADVATKPDLERLKEDLAQFELRLELRFDARLQEKINGLFLKLVFAMLGSQMAFAGLVVALLR